MNSSNSARDISIKQEESEDHGTLISPSCISIKQEESEDHCTQTSLSCTWLGVKKEEVSPERSPSLFQEEPEPPQIKEEEQEEQCQRPGEPVESMLILLAVKSEVDEVVISSHCSEVKVELVSDTEVTEDSDNLRETSRGVHIGETPFLKPFLCKDCGKGFSWLSGLKSHQRIHTGEKPFHCKHCDKSFSWSTSLKAHKRIHTGEKPFHCKYCDKSFSESGQLKRHQYVHTGEYPHHCKHCDMTYIDPSRLKRHNQQVHAQREKLPSHLQTGAIHTKDQGESEDHGTQTSPSCTWLRVKKDEVEDHSISSHCSEVKVELEDRDDGGETSGGVHVGEKTPFLCKRCGKSFTAFHWLKIHQRIHTGPFHCKHCDKSFLRSNSLKIHQYVHTGEKAFHCKYCDMSFSDSSDLRRHQVTHTQGFLFHCKHCDKSFPLSYSLKRHQCVHTGGKPFHCQYCDMSFSDSSALKRHHRTHKTPFHCKHCDKSFLYASTLKTHQQVHAQREKLPSHLQTGAIHTKDQVKNLGVIFDSDLNTEAHIRNVTKFYQLKNIAKVQPFLSQADTE